MLFDTEHRIAYCLSRIEYGHEDGKPELQKVLNSLSKKEQEEIFMTSVKNGFIWEAYKKIKNVGCGESLKV